MTDKEKIEERFTADGEGIKVEFPDGKDPRDEIRELFRKLKEKNEG